MNDKPVTSYGDLPVIEQRIKYDYAPLDSSAWLKKHLGVEKPVASWVEKFMQNWKPILDAAAIGKAKRLLEGTDSWMVGDRGWYVENGGRLNWGDEYHRFDNEFAARMFAAGMSTLFYRGYGEIRQDINTSAKYFQEFPQP